VLRTPPSDIAALAAREHVAVAAAVVTHHSATPQARVFRPKARNLEVIASLPWAIRGHKIG